MPGSTREVRLFRRSRNQAMRIPVAFERPGDRALIRKERDRLIIEPVRKACLLGLPEIDAPVPPTPGAQATAMPRGARRALARA